LFEESGLFVEDEAKCQSSAASWIRSAGRMKKTSTAAGKRYSTRAVGDRRLIAINFLLFLKYEGNDKMLHQVCDFLEMKYYECAGSVVSPSAYHFNG